MLLLFLFQRVEDMENNKKGRDGMEKDGEKRKDVKRNGQN
tara:strand:- start:1764 stop:1883 length:120 start_codon:yes stop_codon:yes gene_type:complete